MFIMAVDMVMVRRGMPISSPALFDQWAQYVDHEPLSITPLWVCSYVEDVFIRLPGDKESRGRWNYVSVRTGRVRCTRTRVCAPASNKYRLRPRWLAVCHVIGSAPYQTRGRLRGRHERDASTR